VSIEPAKTGAPAMRASAGAAGATSPIACQGATRSHCAKAVAAEGWRECVTVSPAITPVRRRLRKSLGSTTRSMRAKRAG